MTGILDFRTKGCNYINIILKNCQDYTTKSYNIEFKSHDFGKFMILQKKCCDYTTKTSSCEKLAVL